MISEWDKGLVTWSTVHIFSILNYSGYVKYMYHWFQNYDSSDKIWFLKQNFRIQWRSLLNHKFEIKKQVEKNK